MYAISSKLSRFTLRRVICEGFTALRICEEKEIGEQQLCGKMREELTQLLYSYLERFDIDAEILTAALIIFIRQDVMRFKDIQKNNFLILLSAYNASNEKDS